ncbi:MAG: AMP-binding protein [Lachnospiraceae bacterium]|nr:AMP-binding protein [Lachnospiraceae bacterium]
MITYENTRTVRELLEKSIAEHPDVAYLRYEREDDVVYDISYERFGELCRIIGSFINGYRGELGRQVKVGLFGSSSVYYIATLMGVMASGNIVVPLDCQMDLEHLADCLNRADVDILFYDWEHEPLIADLKPICPKIREYYSLQSVKKTSCLNDVLMDPRFPGTGWSCDGALDGVAPDDLVMILFTSGTTGHSKGVMLTNANLVGNVLAAKAVDDPEPRVVLNVLPIHHAFCINTDVLHVMYCGGTLCINGPLSLLGKHLRMFEPVLIFMVPMIAKALYNKIVSLMAADPGLTERDALHQVYGKRISRIVCGGGGLPQELAEKYHGMGVRIGQGYGMSECSPVISQAECDRSDKMSSAGYLLDHVELRVADNGEIQVRSPFVMKGYYGDPELTKEAFTDDGWLHTGDIGYTDDENFVYITGRLKNLIILSNGENVAPEELESLFATEPLVKEVIVFGEDDILKCEIYPDFKYAESAGIDNVLPEAEELVKRLNKKLPLFKQIVQTGIRRTGFKKTTSKKIIRSLFFEERRSVKEKKANLKLPESEAEKKIYELCASCIGNRRFGTDTDLYTAGLDSFASIMLLTSLQDECGFSLSLTELMENPTVGKLAKMWDEKTGEGVSDHPVLETYPLTRLQMFFAYVMRGNTTANLPFFFRISDKVDPDRLEEAVRKLFTIHPILSDRIEPGADGKLENHRDDDREVYIERLKLDDAEWEKKRKSLLFPYTYTPGENLYHIGIYETEEADYFFFDVAHIIGDGMTMNILIEDLNALYMDKPVKRSGYSFYEYILDEYKREEAGLRDKDIAFFKDLLNGLGIRRSILAKMDSYDLGKAHNAVLKGKFHSLTKKDVQGFCTENGVSENVLFLTAFSYAVSLFSGTGDIPITSIHNGRTDGRWVRLAGSFFATYIFRYRRIPHETVEQLLKRNADQILHTMETHMSSQHADEMFIQYQGDLLNIPRIGGEEAEGIKIQLDSLPFHLMIYAVNEGYTYELRYWENRFDRNMLEVFMNVFEDIIKALPEETSARKLKDHLSARLYPKHFSIEADKLNASLGYDVVPSGDTPVKAYILDEYGLKKPYGAWGELYILDQPVKGGSGTIESLYSPGTLYDTGIEARITPDWKVEALYQAGRTVMRETLGGRFFINLFELERTMESFPGIGSAEASIEYGENNLFHIKAELKCEKDIDDGALQQFVADKLGKHMIPEIIVKTQDRGSL